MSKLVRKQLSDDLITSARTISPDGAIHHYGGDWILLGGPNGNRKFGSNPEAVTAKIYPDSIVFGIGPGISARLKWTADTRVDVSYSPSGRLFRMVASLQGRYSLWTGGGRNKRGTVLYVKATLSGAASALKPMDRTVVKVATVWANELIVALPDQGETDK